ncbi:CoA transferase [Frankia sp. CNm7]|uniref:CaiB/BaiF CoA transferase family protein n=1 Tax=Frankia nepalensis TaxID=1836974 RepID=UPI001931E465|nr:CoA transferase [Frankia nepalensis]MBL7522775.1 CoA transferase [Frankia nepalensis]
MEPDLASTGRFTPGAQSAAAGGGPSARALDGIRVLDLTGGIAGPLGVLQLAEHGADVIKVEPPGGRPGRALPASVVYDRSRRSVTLDLKDPDGARRFRELLATADVLVEAFAAGTMTRLGLDHAALRDEFPRLVYCSVPAWPTGSRFAGRAGYDALVSARAGLHWEVPSWRPGPVFQHSPVASLGAAYLVPVAIMGAIVARERTGRGQRVEVSLLQGAMTLTTQNWNWTDTGQHGLPNTFPSIHQAGIYECANGEWIHAAMVTGGKPTRTEGEILGIEDVAPAVLFTMPPAQRAAHEAKKAAAFATRDRAELIDELHAAGRNAEPIWPPHERFGHPQLQATGSVVEVVDPEAGPTTQIGPVVFLEKTPAAVAGPRPVAGAHTDEVLGALGRDTPGEDAHGQDTVVRAALGRAELDQRDLGPDAGRTSWSAHGGGSPAGSGGPLAGLRVIDFGQFLAGPFGPMLLADLGAEVIKVESIHADGMRHQNVGPFLGCQRGKRDIALDLKTPEGLEIALRLVATADIVHHNMQKGIADRLGIGYEHCKAARPDILYCNTYMYGPVGPYSHLGGLDPLGQAANGIEWEQGPVPAANPPLWYRYGHGDISAAIPSVLGLLVALFHRGRTGEGQSVWTSILHGSMLHTADSWVAADGTPSPRPALDREQLGLGALYRLYETRDGWLQLAAARPEHWTALCGALGRDDLAADPRVATAAARAESRAELTTLLAEAFRADAALAWRRRLDAAGVPAEISADTRNGETLLFDEDLVRLGLVTEYAHPIHGRVRQFGNLMTFDGTPTRQDRPVPLYGQHTREILTELGYDAATIDALHARRVVSSPPDDYPHPV